MGNKEISTFRNKGWPPFLLTGESLLEIELIIWTPEQSPSLESRTIVQSCTDRTFLEAVTRSKVEPVQRLKFKVFRHSERSYQHNIMKIKCQSCFNNNIRVWRCAEVWILKQWKQWRTVRKTIELLNWAQFPQPEAGNFNTFIYLLRKIDTIKDQSSNNISPKKMPWSCGFDEESFMVLRWTSVI